MTVKKPTTGTYTQHDRETAQSGKIPGVRPRNFGATMPLVIWTRSSTRAQSFDARSLEDGKTKAARRLTAMPSVLRVSDSLHGNI